MNSSEKPSQETLNEWHQDSANWYLGIFYFNKKDKRIFPPKRIRGMGWTVNFANPKSILTMIVLVAVVILISKWLDVKNR